MILLKTGSLYISIDFVGLATMVYGHYTMRYKYGKLTHNIFSGIFYFYLITVFYILEVFPKKTIIPFALAGYEIL